MVAQSTLAGKQRIQFLLNAQTYPWLGGLIQPVVLRDVMGKLDHVDGFWPRFFYAPLQNSRMPVIDFDDDEDTGLETTLTTAYRGLYQLPAQVYRLSPETQQLWLGWHDYTENCRFQHDSPATKTLFRKARARAARIALVAHCLNSAINGTPPGVVISADTLHGAIEYTQWGLNKILSIYADFGVTDNQELVRVARFVQHFREAGWVNARRVIHWWYPKSEINAERARAFMEQVVTAGYATSNGQTGKNFKISVIDIGNNGNKPQESPLGNDLSHALIGKKPGNRVGNTVTNLPPVADPTQENLLPVTYVLPNLLPNVEALEAPNDRASNDLLPLLPTPLDKKLKTGEVVDADDF
jgi:hypothetical protein